MAKKCPKCNSKNTEKTHADYFTQFDDVKRWTCYNCGNYF